MSKQTGASIFWGFPLILGRELCYVCQKEPMSWASYSKDEHGIEMNFCEKCKMEWIVFAGKYGLQFGTHEKAWGVTDGHNAHCINASPEIVVEIWNRFIKKQTPFIFR